MQSMDDARCRRCFHRMTGRPGCSRCSPRFARAVALGSVWSSPGRRAVGGAPGRPGEARRPRPAPRPHPRPHRRPAGHVGRAESIYAVPQEIDDPARTAAELARALASTPPRARSCWPPCRAAPSCGCSARPTSAVARGARPSARGHRLPDRNRRYYPKRSWAAQVLGYVDLDNTGMSGIEYAFDELIRGKEDKVRVHRRAPPAVGHMESPRPKATRWCSPSTRPSSTRPRTSSSGRSPHASIAGGIVMDPRTGEVLALANRPTFNPNRWRLRHRQLGEPRRRRLLRAGQHLQDHHRRRRPAGEGGRSRRGDRLRARVHRGGRHASSTTTRSSTTSPFRDVIAKSSDVGVIRVAQRLGRESLRTATWRLRLRRAHRRRAARRVGGLLRPALERAVPGLPLLRPGGGRHRAADDRGGGRGGERRLPDEAADREAHGGRAGRGRRSRGRSRCAACWSPAPWTR